MYQYLTRTFLVLIAALAVATSARAVNDWGFPGCIDGNQVGASGSRICFDMNINVGTGAFFSVQGFAALACLKPRFNNTGIPAGTPVTAALHFCPNGDVSSSTTCGVPICLEAGCTLTGLTGAPSTQLACIGIGPGRYYVAFPSAPDGADVGLFSVEGVSR